MKSTQNKRITFQKGINCGWFYDEVYQMNVHLVWPVHRGTIQKYIKDVFKMDFHDEAHDDGQCVFLENKSGEMVAIIIGLSNWDKSAQSYSTLCHECFHASEFIFEDRGVKHSDASSEAWAYYLQYLIRKCGGILNGR